jgi:hypothetical protein
MTIPSRCSPTRATTATPSATTSECATLIPTRATRKVQQLVDKAIYTPRNRIERFFNRVKNSRGVATRYEKLAAGARRAAAGRPQGMACGYPPKAVRQERARSRHALRPQPLGRAHPLLR